MTAPVQTPIQTEPQSNLAQDIIPLTETLSEFLSDHLSHLYGGGVKGLVISYIKTIGFAKKLTQQSKVFFANPTFSIIALDFDKIDLSIATIENQLNIVGKVYPTHLDDLFAKGLVTQEFMKLVGFSDFEKSNTQGFINDLETFTQENNLLDFIGEMNHRLNQSLIDLTQLILKVINLVFNRVVEISYSPSEHSESLDKLEKQILKISSRYGRYTGKLAYPLKYTNTEFSLDFNYADLLNITNLAYALTENISMGFTTVKNPNLLRLISQFSNAYQPYLKNELSQLAENTSDRYLVNKIAIVHYNLYVAIHETADILSEKTKHPLDGLDITDIVHRFMAEHNNIATASAKPMVFLLQSAGFAQILKSIDELYNVGGLCYEIPF